MGFLSNLSTKWKLISGFLVVAAITAMVGCIGFWGVWRLDGHIEEIGEVRLPAVQSLQTVMAQLERIGATTRTLGLPGVTPEMRAEQQEHLTDAREIYQSAQAVYDSLPKTGEEAELWEQYMSAVQAWRDENNQTMEMFTQAGDDSEALEQAVAHLLGPVTQRQRAMLDVLDRIVEINQNRAAEEVANAESMAATAQYMALGGSFVGVGLAVVFGLFLASSIAKVLTTLIGQTKRLGEAVVAGKLETRGNPETVSAEFRPIIRGVNDTLDAVIGPLNMMAEYVERISDGDIPEKIIDEYKGDFNEVKNNLNQLIEAELRIADVANKLAVGDTNVQLEARSSNDVLIHGMKRCIDAMNALEQEGLVLVDAMRNGKLDARANPGELAGSWAKLLAGFNDTLDAVIAPLNVAAEYVDRISKGDMPEKITEDYTGDFNEIKNNLNRCVEALSAMTRKGAIGLALDRMSDKDFSHVIDTELPGVYGELRDNVNAVVTNMREELGAQASALKDLVGQFRTDGSRSRREAEPAQA